LYRLSTVALPVTWISSEPVAATTFALDAAGATTLGGHRRLDRVDAHFEEHVFVIHEATFDAVLSWLASR
jgi:hypothetical protein